MFNVSYCFFDQASKVFLGIVMRSIVAPVEI